MASSNPVFNNSPAFSSQSKIAARMTPVTPRVLPASTDGMTAEQLTELYSRPSAGPGETERMTYEDTVVKTVISFVILLIGAGIGWFLPALAIPAAIVGFVLALVNIFKKKPSPALILTYAAVQGVFVGGITMFFEFKYPGIAIQATLATFVVVGVTLALFANGKIRASKRATKIFLIAMVGYGAFSLLNFILMATGVQTSMYGLSDTSIAGIPLGVPLGILVILMASYSLVLDFENIKTGVQRGAPRIYAWAAAFGIMMTVIWLYLEILRLISILRR